ncbi:hypothetical protein F9802_09820 [Bacillus aerolatus]|uniref:Uncharacterized protein n=1 Tax=Bacillus aerolatus TaxID=2653354 RepID=A0A6I1FEY1_9BACI|nr:hypothetical protein [Bacillus aerolatus]KAB7706492.1 hypothetical protein F9802_09820 [Bacillus aerolatus]
MNWFTIGSLTVHASQLAVIAAFFISAIVLWLKKDKVLLDVYGNAVFLFIAVWKLSILLFSFSLVMQAPLSLLYFNGGWKGVWLAFIFVLLYIVWKCPAEKRALAAWIWMLTGVSFEIVLALLTGQAVLWPLIQLAGGVVLLAIPMKQIRGTVWLFTLWQLLFESLTAELFSSGGLLYIGAALFFTLIIRRDPVE